VGQTLYEVSQLMIKDIVGKRETTFQLASKEYLLIRFTTGNKRIAIMHEYLMTRYCEEVDLKRIAALVNMAEDSLCHNS